MSTVVNNLQNITLRPDSTAIQAMEVINREQTKMAMIINENNKLLGILTDGDIRRALLHGASLSAKASEIMNTNFLSVNPDTPSGKCISLMKSRSLRYLPVVDNQGALLDLINSDGSYYSISLSNSVVIMAGGRGTRLHPHTLDCPKPMLHVAGKPMLEILIDQCVSFGFRSMFISVNYLKEKIIDYFGDGSGWGVQIQYLLEDKPLGTAGSLKLLPDTIDGPFLLMNADVLTQLDFRHLLDFHDDNNCIATVCAREHELTVPFGVIEHDGPSFVSLIEKPTYKYLVNAGVYVLDPKVLDFINPGETLDMPSLLNKIDKDGHQISVCPIHEYWLDIGRPETLKQAHHEWNEVA